MYKLKQGVNLPKEFKIKVNPEQSEALQLHLFSIGYNFGIDQIVKNLEYEYLYIWSDMSICKNSHGNLYKYFKDHEFKRIKFKDYFEKVTNQFPEKWCIEATQDNCNELNVWMHRNWKNYKRYTDMWQVTIGGYFMSEGNLHHTEWDVNEGFTIITTEQFRKQFGIVEAPENWQDKAIRYKQRCKDLRRERYEMSKEIKSLKVTIEAIKEIISDNPIIKD